MVEADDRAPVSAEDFADAQVEFAKLSTGKNLPMLLEKWRETIDVVNEEHVALMEFWIGCIFLVLSATEQNAEPELAQAIERRMREGFLERCSDLGLDKQEMRRFFGHRVAQYRKVPVETFGLPEWNVAFVFCQNVTGTQHVSAIEVLPLFTYLNNTYAAVKETLDTRVSLVIRDEPVMS